MLIKFVIKRIIILIPVLIGISIILFAISKFMPGDPVAAMLSPALRPEVREAVYEATFIRLGLDRPIYEQYFRWMYNFLVVGDFGYSSFFNRPVADVIGEPLRNTIILNVSANFIYLLIALPVGIRMAVKRGSLFDSTAQVLSLAAFSVPSFFLSLSLIFIFSITLGVFPVAGMPNALFLSGIDLYIGWIRHLTLPVATLVILGLASAIRYVRNAMIDALSQDYIRTARAKGLSEKVVIYSHAFRNALIPISTVIVFTLFGLLLGAVVTESVFSYHGIGRLLLQAVIARDRMLILSMTMLFSFVNVAAVLVADVIYGLVDPRIKLK